ncbi:hypothetical protein ABT126_41630 [Streptomyces sp. NPDC002012]|uniref:hypothetical protein n=1 Tax=unclassified Streptomyces TaxID=2593676 RepID=UPI00331E2327
MARQRPDTIPYITSRKGEVPDLASNLRALPDNRGLCYTFEHPRDRCPRGYLCGRVSQNRHGNELYGEPEWVMVHPGRQREAMFELRCQVCMGPASRTTDGYLFLTEPITDGRPYEGLLTAQPPVCLKHARVSRDQCGHLVRKGAAALRVRVPRLFGVIGTHYEYSGGKPRVIESDGPPIPYTDERMPWVLISQLVRRMNGVTVVDLDQELTADPQRAGTETCPGGQLAR